MTDLKNSYKCYVKKVLPKIQKICNQLCQQQQKIIDLIMMIL